MDRQRYKRRGARRLFAEKLEWRLLLTSVTSLDPPANSHSAPQSTNISATFDDFIRPVGVNTGSFVVHSMLRRQLVGPTAAVSSLGPTVTLNPSFDFFPGELVHATATADIRGFSGAPVDPYVWQLRTGVAFGLAEFGNGQPSFGNHSTIDVALGDVDNDGDLDAFSANYAEGNRVWLNDGGSFSDSGQILGNGNSTGVAIGDLDGDGDLDAFVANYDRANRVWINYGGVFTDTQQTLGRNASSGVSLGDLDGDGDLDAFVSNNGEPNRVWLNDAGVFTDSGQTLGAYDSSNVSLGDVDNDGDLDAFVVNRGANRVWINEGAVFSDNYQQLGDHDSTDVSLGDLDGDGDLDAFVANDGAGNRIWLNNSNGTFTDSAQTLGTSNSYSVQLGDFDADGDLDAFVANSRQSNQIWLNSAGVFSNSGQVLGDHDSTGLSIGDLDNDGDLDALVATSGTGHHIWNNRNATFSLSPASITLEEGDFGTTVFAFTVTRDLDTQGAASVDYTVTPTVAGLTANDFVGGVLPSGTLNFADGVASLPLLIEVMPDGAVEADESFTVTLSNPTGNSEIGNATAEGLILNDDDMDMGDLPSPFPTLLADNGASHGAFGPMLGLARDSEPDGQPTENADGDDADGTPDDEDGITFETTVGAGQANATATVVASAPAKLDAWIDFDGDLNFDDVGEQILQSRDVVAGINQVTFIVPPDAPQDVVTFARFRLSSEGGLRPTGSARDGEVEDHRVTIGSPFGSGQFRNSGQSLGDHRGTSTALGDLDGDGDLDAFVGNYAEPNQVWWNDSGSFSDSGQPLGDHNTSSVALGDLDRDGDLDAFVTNRYQADRIWLNEAGSFVDSGQSLGDHDSSEVALGDLDGDGDLDAFVTTYLEGQRVLINNGRGRFSDSGQVLGDQNAAGVALDDLDGDGDLDAFVANRLAGNLIWLYDAAEGVFTASDQSLGNRDSSDVALDDFDGDGDVDALVINADQGNRLWVNEAGIFTDTGQSLGNQNSQGVAIGDLDGDGDLDAVVSNSNSGNRIWLNSAGLFSDSGQSLGSRDSRDVALGDLDADGDVDVFVTNFAEGNQVWLNQTAAFVISPPAAVLAEDDVGGFNFTVTRTLDTRGTATVDYTFAPSGSDPVEMDDFVGATFPNGTLLFEDGVSSLPIFLGVAGDTDVENDETFVVTLSNPTGGGAVISSATASSMIRNDDNVDLGDLPDPLPTRLVDNGPAHVATGPQLGAARDIETDGQPTQVANGDDDLGVDDEDGVTFGAGVVPGNPRAEVTVNVSADARIDAWIDFNGDLSLHGAQEQIFTSHPVKAGNNVLSFAVPANAAQGVALATRFRLSSVGGLALTGGAPDGEVEDGLLTIGSPAGNGRFTESGQSLGTHDSFQVSLGDLDGDGDLDAMVAGLGPNRIWVNDGGLFSDSGQALGSSESVDVALGDLDADGDLDAWVANRDGANHVWLNQGGVFSDTGQELGARPTSGVALGDLDGDGDLDAFIANDGAANGVWWNEGGGLFQDSGQTLGNEESTDVTLGDLDGDGDLDAFVTNRGFGNRVWLNQDGRFDDSGQLLADHDSLAAALGDLDGDGDLDAMVANYSGGEANRIWLNDGGTFIDSGQELGNHSSFGLALGDLDGDGDLDAMVANRNQGNQVWLNSAGVFTNSIQRLGTHNSLAVSLGDLDGDGDVDAFSANISEGNRVWLNRNPALSLVPSRVTEVEGDAGFTRFFFAVAREFDTSGVAAVDFEFTPSGEDPADPEDFVHGWPTGGRLIFDVGVTSVPFVVDVVGDTSVENDEQFTLTIFDAISAEIAVSSATIVIRNDDSVDLGDLPAPFPTTLGRDGPAHIAVGPTLGAARDTESDGQPTAAADGDDAASPNDEDGVIFGMPIRAGQAGEVTVVASADALLDAWIDFNGDESFAGAGERIFTSQSVLAGSNALTFPVPASARVGSAFSRFRLSSAGGLISTGGAPDGEVEDHQLVVESPTGNGTLVNGGQRLGDHASRGVTLGDLDGDGDLDALVPILGEPDRIWVNSAGVFADSGQMLGDYASTQVALGDLDRDGDLDAFITHRDAGNRVWLNDAGVLSDSGQDLGTSRSNGVALGDFDSDGDLDALVANEGSGNQIWVNDGGVFSGSGQGLGSHNSNAVAVGDLDGDGDLDAIVANNGANRIWVNDQGRFSDSGQVLGDHESLAISLGDLDGDGDLDAIVANLNTANRVWLNNMGTFIDSGQELGDHRSYGVALGDLDGDGDLDALVANSNQGNRIWVNDGGVLSDSGQSLGNHDSLGVAIGDLDGDGDLDAYEANYADGDHVWLNQLATTTNLQVSSLTATMSGFVAEFSEALDATVLNLFNTGGLGEADAALQGQSVGQVAGSLVVDSSSRSVTFIKTGGPLAADTYTVTLRSAAESFVSAAGLLLDGNDDGTAGDDYVESFVITPVANGVRLSVADFVRGPGQPVNLPADQTLGLPVSLSDRVGIRNVALKIAYNPALLEITSAAVAPGMPAGATVALDTSTTGVVEVTFASPADLPAGEGPFVYLQATVPTANANAIYRSQELLDIHSVSVRDASDSQLPVIEDDAIHVSMYLADASGNGRVNANDASQVAQVAALLQAGFAAAPLSDPILIGDVTGNGRINAADAAMVARVGALLPVPEVPPIPPGVLANRVGVSSLGTLGREVRPEVSGVRLQRRGADVPVWWGAGDEARSAAEATNDYAELVDRALVDLFEEEDGLLGRLLEWGYNSHWHEAREAERGARRLDI